MQKKIQFEDRSFALGLSNSVAMMLFEAHEALYGHTRLGTATTAWNSLRSFARFLADQGLASEERLPPTVLLDFYDWLVALNIQPGTKLSYLNDVRTMIRWCYRNLSDGFEGRLIDETRVFHRQAPNPLPSLSEDVSKKIMKAALSEIEEVIVRLSAGRQEVLEKNTERARLIVRLLEIGGGNFPSQRTISRSGEALSRKTKQFGLKSLHHCVLPSSRDLLPFLVAIQFQLAGNPLAVMALRRGCIEAHSLRSDREWVTWEKPRSLRMQRADFPSDKSNAAPSLIRNLLRLTAPLLELNPPDSEALFLCYDRGRVSLPVLQTWHHVLHQFCARHEIPTFAFTQLRRTSAVLHHQGAGSILAARQKLNHLSVATTMRYSSLSDRDQQHDRVIVESQNALHARTKNPVDALVHSTDKSSNADTVFGFICRDPFSNFGAAPSRNTPCDHFYRCATCPGALVPLDSVNVIAALLKTRASLEETQGRAALEGWIQRFNVLYLPTLEVLNKNLLPNVAEHVMEAASQLATARPFPRLE